MDSIDFSSRKLRIVGILFLIFVLSFVEGVFFTWIMNGTHISYSHIVYTVEGLMGATVRFGILIVIASMLPQLWVKIPTIIILGILWINAVLAQFRIFDLYKLFSEPGPFEYFQF